MFLRWTVFSGVFSCFSALSIVLKKNNEKKYSRFSPLEGCLPVGSVLYPLRVIALWSYNNQPARLSKMTKISEIIENKNMPFNGSSFRLAWACSSPHNYNIPHVIPTNCLRVGNSSSVKRSGILSWIISIFPLCAPLITFPSCI